MILMDLPREGADPLAEDRSTPQLASECFESASNFQFRLRSQTDVLPEPCDGSQTVQQMGPQPPQKASGIGSKDYRSFSGSKSLNIALQLVRSSAAEYDCGWGLISVLIGFWPNSRTNHVGLAQQAILVH